MYTVLKVNRNSIKCSDLLSKEKLIGFISVRLFKVVKDFNLDTAAILDVFTCLGNITVVQPWSSSKVVLRWGWLRSACAGTESHQVYKLSVLCTHNTQPSQVSRSNLALFGIVLKSQVDCVITYCTVHLL